MKKSFATFDWLMQLPEWLNRQIFDEIEFFLTKKSIHPISFPCLKELIP